jgi:flagellar biogenesis protein FliO
MRLAREARRIGVRQEGTLVCEPRKGSFIMTTFLQLIFAILIIIAAAKAGSWIAVRLRQPAALGTHNAKM